MILFVLLMLSCKPSTVQNYESGDVLSDSLYLVTSEVAIVFARNFVYYKKRPNSTILI